MGWIKLMVEGLLKKLTAVVRVSRFSRAARFDLGSLPDDILVEILIRLPAEQILECRRVCKLWNTLTSTPLFTMKHFIATKSDNPAIIILYKRFKDSCTTKHGLLLDGWGVKARGKPKDKLKNVVIKTANPNLVDKIRFNRDGVLTLCPYAIDIHIPGIMQSFALYNPVTHQELALPPQNHLGSVCACFYHQSAHEYKVLYYRRADDRSVVVEYRILSLGSPAVAAADHKLSWKRLPDFDLAPSFDLPEAIPTCYSNNEVLHWVSAEKKDVRCNRYFLAFDVDKEEFSSMAHPGDLCTGNCDRHERMYPCEFRSGVESLLCLCDCSIQDHQIDMWVLENHEKRIWVKRHSILLTDHACAPLYRSQPKTLLGISLMLDFESCSLKPFGVLNGEVLINVAGHGIFAYRISSGTLRKIVDMRLEKDGFGYVEDVRLIQKSLVPFPNFNGNQIVMEPY